MQRFLLQTDRQETQKATDCTVWESWTFLALKQQTSKLCLASQTGGLLSRVNAALVEQRELFLDMQEEEDLRVLEWGEGMNGMELQWEASVAFDAEQLVCWLMSLSLFFFRFSTYCLFSVFLRLGWSWRFSGCLGLCPMVWISRHDYGIVQGSIYLCYFRLRGMMSRLLQ